jgi:hypothetical protein
MAQSQAQSQTQSQAQSQAQSQTQSQTQSSISLPDAQPDLFREFFKPPSPELSDIQDSLIDFEPETSRDKRIAIKTALLFKIPHAEIRKVLNITEKQIIYARNHQVTPQKSKTGKSKILYLYIILIILRSETSSSYTAKKLS